MAASSQVSEPVFPEQFKKLDKFFSRQPFGCNYNDVVELASILVPGYVNKATAAKFAPLFTVFFCKEAQKFWISLRYDHGTVYGFKNIEKGESHFESHCERLATPEEAAAFIQELETIDPVKFGRWIADRRAINWPEEIYNAG